MDEIDPLESLGGIICPYYLSGKRGHPLKNIEVMQHMYLTQNWFNLSDAGIHKKS